MPPTRCAVPGAGGTGAASRPRLVLLRHGEAEAEGVDHQRRLTPAGVSSVRALARALADKVGVSPFLVLCSDTVRSRETWDTLVSERPSLGGGDSAAARPPVVRHLSSLYTVACLDGETSPHLVDLLRSSDLPVPADGRHRGGCVLCIGHNRGWEEAASWLAGVPVSLSPASAAVLDAADAQADWAGVLGATAEAAVTHQKQAGRLADTAWVLRAVV